MTLAHFKGTWRSYKVFYTSGGVKKHSPSAYMEIGRDEQDSLTFKYSVDRPYHSTLPAGEWVISEANKRYYLDLQGKRGYEVLTLDKYDLVLLDLVKGEKIFFAPLAEWNQRVAPADRLLEHQVSIMIWSKDLIKRIKH